MVGELRINAELDYGYHVIEKDHQFLKIDQQFYRKNEIWRNKILKFKNGEIIDTKLITKNFSHFSYTPENFIEEVEEEIGMQ